MPTIRLLAACTSKIAAGRNCCHEAFDNLNLRPQVRFPVYQASS